MNIRYPSTGDHGNLWDERCSIAADMLREKRPDVIGMQEAYATQIKWILKEFPDYFAIAQERRGTLNEEHNPIFLRRDRFIVEESGTFWLSDTPDVVGSITWLPAGHPRIVTWAKVVDLEESREVMFLNTHMQLANDDIRSKSSALIWRHFQKFADVPGVLTGDFNTIPGTPPYMLLTGEQPMPDGSRCDLTDCHCMADTANEPAGTFHNFTGTPREGRIDWIFTRNGLAPASFETITWNRDGRYVSDHFPVMSDIDYLAQP